MDLAEHIINPCIDRLRILVHFDCESDSLQFVASDMFGTSSALRTDNTWIQAHQSIEFYNLHKHSNPRGNLYPLKPHEPFPRCLQLV